MHNLIQKHLLELNKAQDKYFEYVLRNLVKPIIKGNITRGKIKWRGLKICNQVYTNSRWIEQRGVQVGEKFTWNFKVKGDNTTSL